MWQLVGLEASWFQSQREPLYSVNEAYDLGSNNNAFMEREVIRFIDILMIYRSTVYTVTCTVDYRGYVGSLE
jgi:hypothetical protein